MKRDLDKLFVNGQIFKNILIQGLYTVYAIVLGKGVLIDTIAHFNSMSVMLLASAGVIFVLGFGTYVFLAHFDSKIIPTMIHRRQSIR